MNDQDKQHLLSEVNRLNGVLDEIQDRLLDVEHKLDHTSYRLFKMVVMTGAGFAVLVALTGAIFLSSLF